jgi:putative ABC transport system substrate-binding protein
MNRRDTLISLIALGAAAQPLFVAAQRPDKVRRIGVLMAYAENDTEAQSRLALFKERLAVLGWTENSNLSIEVRWSASDVDRTSTFARDLVALRPDLILSSTTPVTAALQRETQTIPIVFAAVSDPVGSGFVKTLSHPGGNITGFINLESSLIEKWVELLKEIAPRVTRVAVMFNPDTAPYAEYYMRPLRAAAPKLGVTVFMATVRSQSEIEEAITGLRRKPDGGLVVMTDSFMVLHRKAIIALAARHKVPAIYYSSFNVQDGGLISYGVNVVDLFLRAASYVDRILRGAKPADLPVEQPTKFELAINMKTAKALGITIPQSILVRADTVIE